MVSNSFLTKTHYQESPLIEFILTIQHNCNDLIGLIRQLNLLSTKTDGKIVDGLTPKVYNITGSVKAGDVASTSNASDTFTEFEKDYFNIEVKNEEKESI